MKRLGRFFLILFLVGISMAGLSGFSYYKEITISHANVDADLSNFPAYVPIINDADIGGECLSTGYDVQFADVTNDNVLTFERLPGFAVTSGQANGDFYVLVPTVAGAANTIIRCYYGKAGASDASSPENTFLAANGWSAVWHLEEASDPYLDATSNDNDSYGGIYPVQVTGKIAKGQDFELASGHFFGINNSASLNMGTSDFTISFWANKETWPYDYVMRKGLATVPMYCIYIGDDGTARTQIGDTVDFATCVDWDVALTTGTWFFVTIRCDRSETDGLQVIVNAVFPAPYKADPTAVGDMTSDIPLMIGARTDNGENSFDGILDEIRIAKTLRSDAWVKFDYYNSHDGHAAGNELTWGAETAVEVGTATPIGLLLTLTVIPGNTYDESPANTFSSTPACFHSTFVGHGPSLNAFISTPVLSPASQADLLGGITLASVPTFSRLGTADLLAAMTILSGPAASFVGGMAYSNELTFLSNPAMSMARNLGIFPSALILSSNPAFSPSALAELFGSVAFSSMPAFNRAVIADFFNSLSFASNPVFSTFGGSDFYNSVTFSSNPALSNAVSVGVAAAITLLSNPAWTTQNTADLLAAISLSSNPALSPAAALSISLAITLASNPAFSTAGGSDFFNSIALASVPAFSGSAFKEAFPSISLSSNPVFTAMNIADLLAGISTASSPTFLTICGFDFIEAVILASGGTIIMASELTSGPLISIGMKRAAAGMSKRAQEATLRSAPPATRREC